MMSANCVEQEDHGLEVNFEDYVEIQQEEFEQLRLSCRRLMHTAKGPRKLIMAFFEDGNPKPTLLKIMQYQPYKLYRRR